VPLGLEVAATEAVMAHSDKADSCRLHSRQILTVLYSDLFLGLQSNVLYETSTKIIYKPAFVFTILASCPAHSTLNLINLMVLRGVYKMIQHHRMNT
jgi:hypothetical protein